jgi:hypothetical protein
MCPAFNASGPPTPWPWRRRRRALSWPWLPWLAQPARPTTASGPAAAVSAAAPSAATAVHGCDCSLHHSLSSQLNLVKQSWDRPCAPSRAACKAAVGSRRPPRPLGCPGRSQQPDGGNLVQSAAGYIRTKFEGQLCPESNLGPLALSLWLGLGRGCSDGDVTMMHRA